MDFQLKRNRILGPRFAACPLLIGTNVSEDFDALLKQIAEDWLAQTLRNVNEPSLEPVNLRQRKLRFAEVSITLGVPEYVVRSLAKKGTLQIDDTPCAAFGWIRGITMSSLANLMRCLKSDRPDIGFGKQAASLTGLGSNFFSNWNLLRWVVEGDAKTVAFDERIGLMSLVAAVPVKSSEVKPIKPNKSDWIGIQAAAAILGIHYTAVYRAVTTGFLRAEKLRGRSVKISAADLERFRHAYVFVGELAKVGRSNSTNLAKKLIAAGVKPVHGPAVDGGLAYAFRREDVAKWTWLLWPVREAISAKSSARVCP